MKVLHYLLKPLVQLQVTRTTTQELKPQVRFFSKYYKKANMWELYSINLFFKAFNNTLKLLKILLVKLKDYCHKFLVATCFSPIKGTINFYYKLVGLFLLVLLLQGCSESCLDRVYRSIEKTGKPTQIIDRGSSPILGNKCEVIYYDDK